MARARTRRTSRRTRRPARKAAPRRAASPRIDVLVESPEWRRHVHDVSRVAARAARAALADGRRPAGCELCLVLADNHHVRRLNRAWRGQNKPTNVLSFPAADPRGAAPRLPAGIRVPLGDVVVASGVTVAEARAQGKPVDAHLSHLIVHGVLHLLGHDHEDDAEAQRMEALETRILRRLGVADPYRVVP